MVYYIGPAAAFGVIAGLDQLSKKNIGRGVTLMALGFLGLIYSETSLFSVSSPTLSSSAIKPVTVSDKHLIYVKHA